MKKVFVSGCFDILHPGHVYFLEQAKSYGDQLYVSVGSDKNIEFLKGIIPTFSESERVFMLNSLKSVYCAFVSSGMGLLDFKDDLLKIKPDVFVVNQDGSHLGCSTDLRKLIDGYES